MTTVNKILAVLHYGEQILELFKMVRVFHKMSQKNPKELCQRQYQIQLPDHPSKREYGNKVSHVDFGFYKGI